MMTTALGLRAQMPESIQHAVLNGLRWYFHWMQLLPAGTESMECRGLELNASDFVYCTPGMVTLELADSPRHAPNVEFISITTEEYAKAVNWFRELHGADVRQNFRTSIRLRDIMPYNTDEERSKSWMEATSTFMASTLRGRSIDNRHIVDLLFPLVSPDDPAYQVYLTVNGRVESIWEFRVIDGKVQNFKRWVYDEPHHSMPSRAQAFADDPGRWYRIVAENRQR